jgi:predicted Zn finger-like uncharacterized protein
MILTCPNCATRYRVDSERLGSVGRLVRCSKCAHTWHQQPPEDLVQHVEPLPLALEGRRRTPGTNLPALPPKARRRSPAVGWAVLVLVVAAVVGGGYLARERIAKAWPPSTKLYALLGALPKPVGQGLTIKYEPHWVTEDGALVLRVDGRVENESQESLEVPMLVGVLRDAQQHDLQQWTFKAAEPKLLPHEIAKFSTSVKNPAKGATNVGVDFVQSGNG